MNRDRRHRRHSGNVSNHRHEETSQREVKEKKPKFRPTVAITSNQIHSENEAIKNFKNSNQMVCPVCSKTINDLSSAMMERGGERPIHFECAMDVLLSEEKLGEGDKIAYIGQGRFGVLNYPNIRDVRHFTIRKIIDWEERDNRGQWRNQMAELFSQVK